MRLLTLFALLALTGAAAAAAPANPGESDPEESAFEFRAVLRPAADPDGFGKVRFRQPVDADKIVYLDVWMRDLDPGHGYYLERATDTDLLDPACTGTNWLRLGKGPTPEVIVTNEIGTGRASLWRDLAAVPTGTQFDIHFRVTDAITGAVVLQSACHRFALRQ